MRNTLARLLALLIAPALHAFPADLTPIAVEFLRADPGNILVQQGLDPWVKTFRTPEERELVEAMYGKIQAGSFNDTDATIKEFAKKYGKLLGIPDDKDPFEGFRKFREFSHANGKWIQYAPTKGGLDDISALVTYVFKDDGMLCAVMGRWRPVTGHVGGGLSRKAAIAKAKAEIKKSIPNAEVNVSGPVVITECLVDDPKDEKKSVRLIGVTLDVGQPPVAKRVLMLGTGEVQYVEDASYHVSGSIFANDPETDNEQVTSGELPDIVRPDSFWRSYVIDGKDVKPDSPSASNRASSFIGVFNEKPFEPDPSEPFAEVATYHYIAKALGKAREGGVTEDELKPFLPLYYDHWHFPECDQFSPAESDRGRTRKNKEADFDACFDRQKNNAWFDPATHKLYFSNFNDIVRKEGPNGTASYKHPGYEGTVVVHEFGHWMHYILSPHHNLTGTPPANLEGRSCGEGVADLFSALVTGDHVIANYFLGDQKRDLTQEVNYPDVLPIWDGPVPADKKGRTMHNASLTFSSAYWKAKGDLGDANALKILVAALRVCHMPCRFQNMAEATLAMDQLLSPIPAGRKLLSKYLEKKIIQGELSLNR